MFTKQGNKIIPFRSILFIDQEEFYAQTVKVEGTPLEKYVGFIYLKKIAKDRPGR